jgi:hypothetical protein
MTIGHLGGGGNQKKSLPRLPAEDASEYQKSGSIYLSDSGSDKFFGVFLFR